MRDVLRGLGARQVNHSWGVGGSQEVETWAFEVDGRTIVVEAETYVGLTVGGDPDLVERVAAGVRERLTAGRA